MVDVCLSDGDRRRVHERRVLDLGLSVGSLIDPETRSALDRYTHIDSAEQRMLRLIASRGRSRAELVERLAALDVDDESALEIVERLSERVSSMTEPSLPRSPTALAVGGMGRLRTQHDLDRLKINEQSAADANTHEPDAERSRAQAVILKRYGAIPTTPADISRAAAYLQRRGYDADTVTTVLRLELD